MDICKFSKIWAVLMVSALLAHCTIASADTIYVDAARNGDGSSWANAYKYLQDALDGASSSDQIWVAAGTYKPDANSSNPDGTGDRYATFQLINGVALYGGFQSGANPTFDDRDPNIYETILSGDLDGNDVDVNNPSDLSADPNRAENCFHVVTGSGTDTTTILDGFTIKAGNANGSNQYNYGSGMYNSNSSPTVTNCIFTRNSAKTYGGGMYNSVSNPSLTNCTFSVNSSGAGGGMYNHNSSPTLTGCAFNDNVGSISGGGGMFNHGEYESYSNPSLTNCTFISNYGHNSGGGMFNQNQASPSLTNCTFINNTSTVNGGGMTSTNSCFPDLVNCTFIGNWADSTGGGIHIISDTTITNCIFTGNSTSYAGGGVYNAASSPTLTNCTFTGNSSQLGGGMHNSLSSLSLNMPKLINCTLSGNSAVEKGGGIYTRGGGGITTLTNCILWGNTADVNGPQIAQSDGTLDVNYCDVQGGLDAVDRNDDPVINWGVYNIDADPNFVLDPNDGGDGFCDDPATEDIDEGANDDFGDLHLTPGSPCIDVGNNSVVTPPIALSTDLDGRPRIADGDCNDTQIVDMGAYEFAWVYIGDFAGGCDVDFKDFAVFALTWLLEEGESGYNTICDISLPSDAIIDENDLKIFTNNWLAGK